MKIYLKILLLSVLLFPIIVSAQVVFEKGYDKGVMMSGNDRYEAGSSVSLATDVAGDYFAAGGTVEISKNVAENIFAAGGTVIINGTSGKNVKAAGGNIVIDSVITGDLMVFGGQINIKKGTKVSGNIFLNGGNIIYEGDTLGDAFINGKSINFLGIIGKNANLNSQDITVASGAKISGNLTYSAKNNNPQLEGVTAGQKNFKAVEWKDDSNVRNTFFGFIFAYLAYRFLFLLIFASILYFGFERFFRGVGMNVQTRPGKSFLYGLLYFAAMPFAILILLLTVIGIPIGLLLLFIYIFSFVFYKLITVTVLSALIINMYLKDKENGWKKFGIILLVAIFITPWSIIDLLLAFFAFGALMQRRVVIYQESAVNKKVSV